MNLAMTLRKLLRRWYILLAGLLLAVAAVVGVWSTVPAQYERTSTQVLLPGQGSLPEGAGNPYLYIGGLSLAADVVVRATGSENMAREIGEAHPGVSFQVSRDPTTAGPVIRTSVSAATDEEAGRVLDRLTERTAEVLVELQDGENISTAERITVVLVTTDEKGVTSDRTRLILSAGAGLAVAGFAVLLAALVEGIAGWRRARKSGHADHGRRGEFVPPPSDAPPSTAGFPAGGNVDERVEAPASQDLVDVQHSP